MRPAASLSATRSISGSGTSLDLRSASAAAADMSSPPKAKQSSLSCAILDNLDTAMRDDEGGDCVDIVELEKRQARFGTGASEATATMLSSSGASKRLAERCAIDLELRMVAALEAFDKNEIDRRSCAAGSRPSPARARRAIHASAPSADRSRPCTSLRPGLTVAPGILARLINIEIMMGVLERRYAHAAAKERGQQARHQRGLAAAAPTRKSEDPHFCHVARLGFAAFIAGA